MANILDLLLSWKQIRNTNTSMSIPYIVYHWCLFVSTLLTPGTIFMLIVGAIIVSFQWIHSLIILIVIAVLVSVFLLMCIYASTQIQVCFLFFVFFYLILIVGIFDILSPRSSSISLYCYSLWSMLFSLNCNWRIECIQFFTEKNKSRTKVFFLNIHKNI